MSSTSTPIQLPESIRHELNVSGEEGLPLVIGYIDAEGKTKSSYRGSTHMLNDNELCLWIRNPEGSLPRAVERDPHVMVIYRNPEGEKYYKIDGLARLVVDSEIAESVFTSSSAVEQWQDPSMSGVALIITPIRLAGVSNDGPLLIETL